MCVCKRAYVCSFLFVVCTVLFRFTTATQYESSLLKVVSSDVSGYFGKMMKYSLMETDAFGAEVFTIATKGELPIFHFSIPFFFVWGGGGGRGGGCFSYVPLEFIEILKMRIFISYYCIGNF